MSPPQAVPSETMRAREVFKCLEPFESSIQPSNFSADGSQDHVPVGSEDTGLAAYCQLAALRLDAQRCIISLLDKDTEYILAESTRTLSLQSDLVHNSRDALWLGTTSFASNQGLATVGLQEWQQTKGKCDPPPSDEEDYYYTDSLSRHWHIISDMRQHPEFHDIPFVKNAKNLRFYASVPIRTPQGHVVGSYAILDNRPRFGIRAEDMIFLGDLADTIMSHLEAKRASLQQKRGDRLIKGLALFNEGKDTLREWWLETYSRNPRGEGRRRRRLSIDEDTEMKNRADEEFGMEYHADEIAQRAPPMTEARDMAPAPQAPKVHQKPGHLSQDKHEGFDLGREVDTTFARSSNLIREAINAEGVAFIDADFARSKKATREQSGASSTEHESDTAGSNAEHDQDHDQEKKAQAQAQAQATTDADAQCDLLGFSTKVKSSLRGFQPSARHSSLPKAFIRSLIRRYPTGKVFNFHDGKALSSSSGTDISDDTVEEEKNSSRSRKRRSREFVDGMTLGNVFSGPRSVAFLPLWDSRKERWRSAVFVWNNAPNRFLDKNEDVTYLAAFTNSLVAELSRLEAVAADQAKATFISSVSHELRSPLHGVLAGVELLQDSELDVYQREMTSTVEMAGRTLLDTINNILDFTKINSFTDIQRKDRKEKDSGRHSGFKTADMGEVGVTSVVDLAHLTENVVDTTVAAKSFQATKHKKITASESEEDVLEADPPHVSVVVNIAKRLNWNISISPGSWTRVITNLLGNALKYTNRGSIVVTLQAKQTERNKTLVSLVIEDTGMGIGSEYLRNHLYMPFMQENTHAVGTGLGLSIVRQIVQDFGGRISFDSELGRGTKVVVSFFAEFDEDTEMKFEIPRLDGRSLDLAFSKSTGKTDVDNADRLVKNITSKLCQEWLGCKTEQVLVDDGATSHDVCVLAESEYKQWQEKRKTSKALQPLVVLGSVSPKQSIRDHADNNTIFLNQPFGPRKMSRALTAAVKLFRNHETSLKANGGSMGVLIPATSDPLHIDTKSANSKKDTKKRTSNQESPSEIPETPPLKTPNTPPTPASPSAQKVLLVEDNDINMKLLVATMKKLHRSYECAGNGLEAVTKYASSHTSFSLVLMDISMPVMDGFTATETIRALEKKNSWDRVTIMALTGVGDADAKKRAYLSGVDDFMTKPVSMQKLRQIVQELED